LKSFLFSYHFVVFCGSSGKIQPPSVALVTTITTLIDKIVDILQIWA